MQEDIDDSEALGLYPDFWSASLLPGMFISQFLLPYLTCLAPRIGTRKNPDTYYMSDIYRGGMW